LLDFYPQATEEILPGWERQVQRLPTREEVAHFGLKLGYKPLDRRDGDTSMEEKKKEEKKENDEEEEEKSSILMIFNNHTTKRPIDVSFDRKKHKALAIVTSHRLEPSTMLTETIGPCYYVYQPTDTCPTNGEATFTLRYREHNIAHTTNTQLEHNALRDWPAHTSYGAFASSMDARTCRHHSYVALIDSIYRNEKQPVA
jgi:hypothetical protein